MDFSNEAPDEATLKELGRRIARYRLNGNLSQDALAQEAGVSTRTVQRIEHGHSTQLTNLVRVLRALGLLGNLQAAVPEPPVSPLQQIRMQGKQRQRASSGADRQKQAEPWSWGDEE